MSIISVFHWHFCGLACKLKIYGHVIFFNLISNRVLKIPKRKYALHNLRLVSQFNYGADKLLGSSFLALCVCVLPSPATKILIALIRNKTKTKNYPTEKKVY